MIELWLWHSSEGKWTLDLVCVDCEHFRREMVARWVSFRRAGLCTCMTAGLVSRAIRDTQLKLWCVDGHALWLPTSVTLNDVAEVADRRIWWERWKLNLLGVYAMDVESIESTFGMAL